MSSKEVSQKESSSGTLADTASSAYKTTSETVTSAAANLSGALSGSLSAGTHASSKKTTTHSAEGGQQKMSKAEADRLYEERIEDEYAKREGGA